MLRAIGVITVLLMAAAPRSAQAATDATAPAVSAQDHIATPLSVGARVAAKAAERERHLATLNAALDSESAARTAALFGTDVSHLKQGLAHLGDADLRDLAARASRLRQDPVGGMDGDVSELLIIFLIVAIVIIVVRAEG